FQYFNDRLSENYSSNSTSFHVHKYNYDSWMCLLSELPLLLFSLLNSCLYQHVRERYRVAFSLVAFIFLFGLTAALVEVEMDQDAFFIVTMATIWFINMFGAVLQGSLFGLVGLFPYRYSTFFMSGQGLGGIFANVAMLLSILNSRSAALGYFITPCVFTLVTLLCYLLLPHLVSAQTTTATYTNSLVVIPLFQIWPMALYVTCIFAVTLSVFPAVTVRVQTVYVENQTWVFTCVCCFIVFNVMDMVGRSIPYLVQWPGENSRFFPVLVVARVVFVPLLMMCNIKNSKLSVLFSHDAAFSLLMALFSFTNGYLATLCTGYAPKLVHSKDAKTAGSLMGFFIFLGLAIGAAFSFLLCTVV
uniref:Solute carrier family 29 member 2 n=1 Tax=Periophthalmus magnuspinnatus TaxID=409849 RepID=A0A3B4AFY0_9GOBI